jgi:hypothetical protein
MELPIQFQVLRFLNLFHSAECLGYYWTNFAPSSGQYAGLSCDNTKGQTFSSWESQAEAIG